MAPGFFRRHVSVRLATIWLVVAIPSYLVMFATYAAWYNARLSLVLQERRGYALSTAESFELLLLRLRLAMRESGAIIAETARSPGPRDPGLASLTSSYPVGYAAFADTGGRVLRATRPDLAGTSIETDTAFRAALRASDGSGMEPSEVTSGGAVGFHVAQMIPARPGRPPGVMVAFVDVRLLARSLQVTVPSGGISLIDPAGQVVFQNEDPRLALARAQWGKRFPFVRSALRGHVTSVFDWEFPLGGRRIGVFIPIEPYGWAAGSSVAPEAALAPFYRARVIGIPVLLAVAVLSLLTSLAIARSFRKSLERLAEDARRVGSGELEVPVKTDRADEIGEVARSLEAARIGLRDARQQADRRLEVERERTRLGGSIAEISARLASSMDIDVTLPGVLGEALGCLGACGGAVADRVGSGWRIREVTGGCGRAVQAGDTFSDEEAATFVRVLNTRQPFVAADVLAGESADRVTAERLGFRAHVTYPLMLREEVTGALTFGFDSPRTSTDEELDYLRRVASAVSLAEESSRLYKAEHRVAETLQTALLALPDRIPGIDFAHMYHSATEAARVGGDFYDLFELEHDMVGVTVGDISGHGVDAAVLTSLVKNAIRVQATQQDSRPHEVVAGASRILYQNSSAEIFATVFFGVLHLDDGLIEYCNAGHTTAACVPATGGVRKLPPNSPLIGAFESEEFGLSEERVDVHDLLFMYTDGLTEARRDRELFGEERLFELLAHERGGDPQRTMRTVVDAALRFAEGRLSDDLAILVVQRAARHVLP